MNQSQQMMAAMTEALGKESWKFLSHVIKGATGADVSVEASDDAIVVTGTKEAIEQARRLMDKVVGLRLERIDADETGLVRAIFIETGIQQTSPGVVQT